VKTAAIESSLARWAVDQHGATATIENVRPMPGNAGFSYGFRLVAEAVEEDLVVRLPPRGAAQTGNADVLKQVTVLEAMATCEIPVPEIRYAADENPWFDTPFYLATFVRGRSTHLFDGKAAHDDGAGLESVFRDAITQLTRIHKVDWRSMLCDWSRPRSLADEIDAWLPTLMKSHNDEWKRHGLAVRDRLQATRPDEHALTVVHGDFYSNNWLFEDDRITAIVDWEIASIGAPGLDLGWLCMIYDQRSWGDQRHFWSAWSPSPEFIAQCYVEAGGPEIPHLEWYRALAGYRLGCITARNYQLHKSGKRPDPAWDILGDALPHMLDRALELSGATAAP
jgi:aminoglycoside phosphotransferase (APT) family kinase protein